MSERFPGGFVTMTPPTVSKTSAPGVWTVDQALQNQQAGVWPFGGPFNYIEEMFSTYLWTGNGTNRTITNGIDLSTNGGLVWIKKRSAGAPNSDNVIYDTERGANNQLATNASGSQSATTLRLTSFNNNGFNLGTGSVVNENNQTFVGWTFRKQAKFFDMVTYTGNGANRTIAHNLGSAPGCILIKKTSAIGQWVVYHRSMGNGQYGILNATNAFTATGASGYFNSTSPTSTEFSVGTNANVNENGSTFIAYLFAHDAGGFGLFGTDNVISCGSYVGNGTSTGPTVTIGFEPQWILLKNVSNTSSPSTYGNWYVYDTMRGIATEGADASLYPNATVAESSLYGGNQLDLTATGFVPKDSSATNVSGETYIYIAIRRGPMRTPTSGTQVYKAVARNGAGTSPWVASGAGFPPDLSLMSARDTGNSANNTSYHNSIIDRVRRATEHIQSVNVNAEGGGWGQGHIHNMDGYDGLYSSDASYWATAGQRYVDQHFRRAPGFLDIVYYTGTGSARTVTHGLTVAPELMIVKARNAPEHWAVYCSALTGPKYRLYLNGNYAEADQLVVWNGTAPTSSVFSVGTATDTNNSGTNYIAYLFASLPGISKIGSYTGTGSPLTVNCGFTNGARFVLIKRKDSTGDWWFFDTARGMVSGNSKALWLNVGGTAEVSGGYVYTTSVGFVVESSISDLNASGGSYIYFAIA